MTVHKILNKLNYFFIIVFSIIIMGGSVISVQAEVTTVKNEDTGYRLILDDEADFLDDAQESALKEKMSEITEYCNVALVTTTWHTESSTKNFAANYFDDAFGPHKSGTIFVIDRDLNEIYLYSDGNAHKTITNSRAYSITDNTYVYATSDHDYDYYTCAYKTFEQVLALLQGKRIAEPMRYLCSALLAIILAAFINFFLIMFSSGSRKPDMDQVLAGTYTNVDIQNANTHFVNQTRVYDPPSSSSSSGGHSGGGGGGHSGGGGGHSI